MISCKDFAAHIDGYVEGDVAAELRLELEYHLARCGTCQVIVDSARKTLKIVTEAGQFDLSEALPEPLVDRIMTGIRKRREGES